MEVGPIQMLILGFEQPQFGGGITAELGRLRQQGIIRLIDALVVHKDAEGQVRTLQASDLGPDQAKQLGAIVGALVGLGADGGAGMAAGAEVGAAAVEDRGGHILDAEEWDALEGIPEDSAAAILLIEHRWAIPLRNAIVTEGGVALGDAWLHPRDLVAAGVLGSEEIAAGTGSRAAG